MSLKRLTYKPIYRYFSVILCGYIFDFIIYTILIKFGSSIFFANASAFFVGVIINTILIRRYVFIESKYKILKDIQLSFLSSGLMFGFGMFFLWGLVEFFNINPYLAKLIANVFTFACNYLIRKFFFRKI